MQTAPAPRTLHFHRASPSSSPHAARPHGTRRTPHVHRPPALRRGTALAAVKSADVGDGLSVETVELMSQLTAGVDLEVAAVVENHSSVATAGEATGESSVLTKKVTTSIRQLQAGLLEREIEVRLLLLAALCGEHLLLLGPPGTAKSELSRRLSSLCGGAYFERLLTRFSVPEELFGPLSMRGLENDVYERKTDGYLPTAEVAFIDEIFKANSAILNALLTLLNERLFDNGNERLEAPLLCLVGASNELPESEELDALYDRFLIRRQVAQVSSGQLSKLAKLAAGRSDLKSEDLSSDTDGQQVDDSLGPIAIEEFRDTATAAYSAVDVPESVIDILTSLRDYLQDKCEPPIYVSDRRFMKSIQMLQVAAHADGREQVSEYDCLLLEHVFGNRPDDAQKVKSYVLETIASDPGLQQSALVFLGLFGRACRVLEDSANEDRADVTEEVSNLVNLLESRHLGISRTLDGEFPDLRATIWQSEGTVQAAVQSLTPQMTENRKKVVELLREGKTVEACLSQQTPPGVLEKLLPKRFKQYKKGVSGAK